MPGPLSNAVKEARRKCRRRCLFFLGHCDYILLIVRAPARMVAIYCLLGNGMKINLCRGVNQYHRLTEQAEGNPYNVGLCAHYSAR